MIIPIPQIQSNETVSVSSLSMAQQNSVNELVLPIPVIQESLDNNIIPVLIPQPLINDEQALRIRTPTSISSRLRISEIPVEIIVPNNLIYINLNTPQIISANWHVPLLLNNNLNIENNISYIMPNIVDTIQNFFNDSDTTPFNYIVGSVLADVGGQDIWNRLNTYVDQIDWNNVSTLFNYNDFWARAEAIRLEGEEMRDFFQGLNWESGSLSKWWESLTESLSEQEWEHFSWTDGYRTAPFWMHYFNRNIKRVRIDEINPLPFFFTFGGYHFSQSLDVWLMMLRQAVLRFANLLPIHRSLLAATKLAREWINNEANRSRYFFIDPSLVQRTLNSQERIEKADKSLLKLNEGTKQDRLLRSNAIDYLLNSGTDFINNMFDVMLICTTSSRGTTNFFDELYKSLFNSSDPNITQYGNIFMVRASSIDVPQMESDSFELKLGYQTIKKVRTKVKFERKADLKILLDEPLFFMGIFNTISNNNRIIFDGISEKNRYPKGFATFSTNSIIRESIINKAIRVDLVIKQELFLKHLEEELRNTKTNAERNFIGLRREELPVWWFEDVKFVGQTENLQFDRDGDTTTDMTFPFLFKRCIKIDRQFRHGVSQTEQFNGLPLENSEISQFAERSFQSRPL